MYWDNYKCTTNKLPKYFIQKYDFMKNNLSKRDAYSLKKVISLAPSSAFGH